jgi:hypothetical protein
MADEKVFLTDSNVFVSNSRIVISGKTYSTANVTSVRKGRTPARQGTALLLIALGVVGAVGSLATFSRATASTVALLFSIAIAVGGLLRLRAVRPSHQVFLASASGETQALSSQDEALIDKVVHAVGEAFVHRG